MKICIVTNGQAAAEPRAIKQALALQRSFPAATVILSDACPQGESSNDPEVLLAAGIIRHRRSFPTRRTAPLQLAFYKAAVGVASARWKILNNLAPAAFGPRAVRLIRELSALYADVYIAHGIDTLLPTSVIAKRTGAKLMFDAMEYYSEMGDSQTAAEARAAFALQNHVLRTCSLVIAASDGIADALVRDHGIARPLPIYNVPPRELDLPEKRSGFSLYWRNYQIGFGQRGLDDALVALSELPNDVLLYLQGKPPFDAGEELRKRTNALGLAQRVTVLPPYAQGDAVRQAAPYTVGLCLERRGPANHEYTVSNKMFDYHMAGLAVVASDLPSLRKVIEQSGGGELFQPGSPSSLASMIHALYHDSARTQALASRARAFALREGNDEAAMSRFTAKFESVVAPRLTELR